MTVQKFVLYNSVDIDGKPVGNDQKLELNVLENSGNYLIHKDILRHQLLKKQGTSSTLTRSEVRGGGRKPWRQKGTGRARAGSNRSPLWRGGGIIFGPKPKKTLLKLNKKEKRLALQTLLYNRRKNISIIDNLEINIESTKTKTFCNICKNCKIDLNKKLLIIASEKTKFLKLATNNLKNVDLVAASSLNTYALLKAEQVILTPLAIKKIQEIFCG